MFPTALPIGAETAQMVGAPADAELDQFSEMHQFAEAPPNLACIKDLLDEFPVSDSKAGSGASSDRVYQGDDFRQNSGKPARTRPYKPRMGPAREKNKETQKRYRERLKSKSAHVEEATQAMAAELAALRLEQETLLTESTVLDYIRQYTESAIGLLRTAAGAFSSFTATASRIPAAAQASLMSVYADVMECIWCTLRRPSDDQLRALICSTRDFQAANPTFVTGLANILSPWAKIPASRVYLERKLALIFETRRRVVTLMKQECPEKLVRMMVACIPPAPAGTPKPLSTAYSYSHLANKPYLLNPELIQATALSEEQRIALIRHMRMYTLRYNDAREAVLQAPTNLSNSIDIAHQGAAPTEPVGCLLHAAEAHLAARRIIDSFNGYTTEELLARIELLLGVFGVLRPLQRAYVFLSAAPNADIVTICESLLQLDGGNSGVPLMDVLMIDRDAAALCCDRLAVHVGGEALRYS